MTDGRASYLPLTQAPHQNPARGLGFSDSSASGPFLLLQAQNLKAGLKSSDSSEERGAQWTLPSSHQRQALWLPQRLGTEDAQHPGQGRPWLDPMWEM